MGNLVPFGASTFSNSSNPSRARRQSPMSSPPLPRHAQTSTLPTAAPARLLRRQRVSLLLVRGSSGAATAATPLVAAAAASPDLACSHYSSVTASPSPRASSSTSTRRSAGGLVVLTVTASAVAVSVCWIFFSAIRSMLACKREAEFLEKYFNSVREKLPETMSSVRLVGREVSNLATDLSDLSQELTKGVKSSMNIVHTAESQLRQPAASALPGTTHRLMSNQKKVVGEPLLASTVRDLRELIADIRSGFGAASGIVSLFVWVSRFGSKRRP